MSEPTQDDERAQLQAVLATLTLKITDLQNQINNLSRVQTANNGSGNGQQGIARDLTDRSTIPLHTNLGSLETPMAATRMITAQMVSPADVNKEGICMGGVVLSWIDECAGLAAKTLARGPCVTASVDAVHFLRPCRVGSVVMVASMVNRTFKSSMEVGVRVEEECPLTGVRHHCCSAYLTFVAISQTPPRTNNNDDNNTVAISTSASSRLHSTPNKTIQGRRELPRVVPGPSKRLQLNYSEAGTRRELRLQRRQHLRNDPEASAAAAACRLLPLTHRVGTPSMPPSLSRSTSATTIDSSNHSTSTTTTPVRHSIPPSLTTVSYIILGFSTVIYVVF
jgi:acyl-CoA hydrolase